MVTTRSAKHAERRPRDSCVAQAPLTSSKNPSSTPDRDSTKFHALEILAAACVLHQIADKYGMSGKHKASPALQQLIISMGANATNYRHWSFVKDILNRNDQAYEDFKVLKEEVDFEIVASSLPESPSA